MANSIDRENVIKVYENFVNGYECFCTSDDIEYEMHKAVLALLKEQEETINDLTDIIRQLNQHIKDLSEYMTPYGKVKDIKACAELLKEQEAVKPVLDKQTGRIWLCGKCGSYVGFEDNDPHDPNEYDKYCRECGRPVLWEGR